VGHTKGSLADQLAKLAPRIISDEERDERRRRMYALPREFQEMAERIGLEAAEREWADSQTRREE
jgi:type VI protein secretion system component VasK